MHIGISQRIDQVVAYKEIRDALDHRLVDWVIDIGETPVPIPNSLVNIGLPINNQKNLLNWLKSMNIEALLLSGGNDIGESPKRDLTEKSLLSWAEKNRIPVLGICRGMQMMGVYAGCKMTKVDCHVGTIHQLVTTDNNQEIFEESVNSYHNYALKNCPDGFKLLAKSSDGCIEAIKHKNLPWEAWMWHPEREDTFSKSNQLRFKKLLE